MQTLKLSERDVPDNSVIAVFSDIHFPHADEPALKVAIECCEAVGVTHVLLNGDIFDAGPASRHEGKRKRAVLEEGCLRESVATGLWFTDWARTRMCWYILGNHEAWCSQYIEQSPELKGTETTELLGLPGDGNGWVVLPDMGRVRLGNRVFEHGNGMFKGGGGQNPGTRIKALAPDQSTSIGHLHRKFAHYWSSVDEEGIARTRAAFGNGHLSIPESHEDYAGSYQGWQQSLEITRVYYVDGRPRFQTDQPEVHRDKRNRPYIHHNGRLFR